uniref:Uncharacterized protein n=1 Tax=Sarcoptes scabiei TaxID=52283 RepID=A0A834R611_SARSC
MDVPRIGIVDADAAADDDDDDGDDDGDGDGDYLRHHEQHHQQHRHHFLRPPLTILDAEYNDSKRWIDKQMR